MHPFAQKIRFCTSGDGTRIAYAISGSGPPLMWVQHWVHNLEFDDDHPIWRPWLHILTKRHALIRYDWRGCGLSDRHQIGFSFENYLADLEAVADAAGFDRFVLFGMAGTGSGIAINYAVRHPERVASLILHECHTKGRLAGSPTPERIAEAQARLKVIELGWPDDTPAYSQFFTALHIPDANITQLRAYNELLRKTTAPANAVRLLRTFWELDLSDVVPQVRCPTLVLHTRGDSVIPFDEGRRVAALIPNARFVPLESQNHLLLETDPAWPAFVTALREFLEASSPGAAGPSFDGLTAREREVLEVMAQGLNNREIAARLKISEKTARNHVSIIFSKLRVGSRTRAVVLAREAGFGRRMIP